MQNHLTITATAHQFLRTRARSQEFRNFLDLLWATGARPADLLALSAEHIDWGAKRLTIVPQKLGPAGPAVQITIDSRLERLLGRLPGSGRLFPDLDSRAVTREFACFSQTFNGFGSITAHSYRLRFLEGAA